jgi:VanZ family protein
MFSLLNKNRLYLFITFMIVIYLAALFLLFIKLYDPNGKFIAGDKYFHFVSFSLFSFLVYFIFSFQKKVPFLNKHRAVITVLLSALIGAVIEYIQYYIPDRTVNIYDWIANILGSLFTVLIIRYIPKGIKRMRRI